MLTVAPRGRAQEITCKQTGKSFYEKTPKNSNAEFAEAAEKNSEFWLLSSEFEVLPSEFLLRHTAVDFVESPQTVC